MGGLDAHTRKKKNFKPHGVRVNPTNPTAFSPLGGPLCPHKEKKDLNPTAFSPLGGGLRAHTRKKKRFKPHGIFAAGGA